MIRPQAQGEAMREAVVVNCGPGHPQVDPDQTSLVCPGVHEDLRCFARADAAIEAAKNGSGLLLVTGPHQDFPGDVRAYATRAMAHGVREVHEVLWQYPGTSGTERGLRACLERLVGDPAFQDVDTVRVVTDPWHMPRMILAAHRLVLQHPRLNGMLFLLRHTNVASGWNPPEFVLARERSYVATFLGRYYGPRSPTPPRST